MKPGNIVKLSTKAVIDFYSTENYSMYFVGDDLKTENFVKYVDDILSFENGVYGGIVLKINQDTVTIKVKSFLTGNWKLMYQDLDSLEIVME